MPKRLSKIDTVIRNQQQHEIADTVRFAQLPTKEDITFAVKSAVEIQINGNLREIKSHLASQDEQLKLLVPAQKATTWLQGLGKVIMYVGGVALVIVSIEQILGIIKI